MGAQMSARRQLRRAMAASVVGNVVEWFDFAVYGYLVSYLAPHFFPSYDPVASTMATFAVFAIGYFARPVGAVILGRFGDRRGRRPLLVLSITLLGLSSCGIGLLPTYASIGIAAPLLLVLLRLVQGFSVGGEYTGSMTYLTEIALPGRRGLTSSFATLGTILGILLSSSVVWLTHETLSPAALADWGWRLPFLTGLLVAGFGLWLRWRIPETLETGSDAPPALPLAAALARYWRELGTIIGIVTGANVALYLVFFFAVDVAVKQTADVPIEALNTVALVFMLPFIPLGGWWSDRRGRRPVSLAANSAMLLLAVPVLALCFSFRLWPGGPAIDPATAFLTGQLLMSVTIGLILGVQGAMVAELLPRKVRCTVFSVAYSLAMALFAGSAPLLAEWMLNVRGWTAGPAVYMGFWLIVAIFAVTKARETFRSNL